jgi:hypothetical protein
MLAQHAQVSRDGRLADREARAEGTGIVLAAREELDDAAPSRVGEGFDRVHCSI